MKVCRRPFIAPFTDGDGIVFNHRGGRETVLQRSEIHERFECRTRLPLGAKRAVEAFAFDATPADKRADRTRGRIERDKRALCAHG